MTPAFAVVTPLRNEAESLAELAAGIAAHAPTPDWEILFIDDGSTDDSWKTIMGLAAADPRIKGIKLRRNFGKAAALAAGFRAARGETIVTMDADLQDDPAELPGMLAGLADADLVSGWKKVRHDPWHKTLPSKVFNGLVSAATGVRLHDHNCGYKAMRAAVARGLPMHGELHRFVPVLAASKGWRVAERAVRHHPRRFGRSNYGWQRFLRGLFDLATVWFATRFGARPLHGFAAAGLLLTLFAAAWQAGGPRLAIGAGPAACLALAGGLAALGLATELLRFGVVPPDEIAATVGLPETPSPPAA